MQDWKMQETTLYGTPHIAYVYVYDSGAYTRMQFLRAVSHSVGDHVLPEDVADDLSTISNYGAQCWETNIRLAQH